MKKLNLKNITLVCVECVEITRALRAIRQCVDLADFADVRLFNSFADIRDRNYVHPIKDLDQYSRFMIRDLNDYIESDFALVVQYDGFIINPKAWTDNFLKYDYIGAPWWYEDENNVGNGGFSLRSKKFLETCSYFAENVGFEGGYFPEDDVLCRRYRSVLEASGVKWAPEDLAAKFAWEGNNKYRAYNGSFGFHGRPMLEYLIKKSYENTRNNAMQQAAKPAKSV